VLKVVYIPDRTRLDDLLPSAGFQVSQMLEQ
jgi:hypothetical protein